MNNVTTPAALSLDVSSRRSEQFGARRVLWSESSIKRVRTCGHHGVLPDGNVAVKLSGSGADSKAGFSGVATCGSTWVCPVCSAKISRGRAADLSAAVTAWHSKGGKVLMLTLTMRHRRGQRLADLWDSLSHAWGKVTSGRGWVRDQETYGAFIPRKIKGDSPRRGEFDLTGSGPSRIGFARVVETTHGAKGWHVHIHALLFVSGDVSASGMSALAGSMYGRWAVALVAKGLTSPSPVHGVDIRVVSPGDGALLGDYFAKNVYSADKAGMEVAGGANKKANNGNRSPFQILADVVRLGDADDLAIWWEWETASHNRRQLTWSTDLRDFLALGAEASDEELAEAELGGEVVLTLAADEWVIVRWHAEQLLHLVETHPLPVVKAWLHTLLHAFVTDAA